MLGLSNSELDVVIRMAIDLPLEKRDTYLQRIAALLQQRAGRHSTADVIEAAVAQSAAQGWRAALPIATSAMRHGWRVVIHRF